LIEGETGPRKTMAYKPGRMQMVEKKLKPWA
jgi:hypothetical protein